MTRKLTLILKVEPVEVAEAGYLETLTGLRRTIFNQCLAFLARHGIEPYSGNCGAIIPARNAWGQELHHPHGVVFGSSDPAVFLYAYTKAAHEMSDVVGKQLLRIADQVKEFAEGSVAGLNFAAITVDSSKLDPAFAQWYKGYCNGAFHREAPLYSIAHGTSNLDPLQHEEILNNMGNYALCVLVLEC